MSDVMELRTVGDKVALFANGTEANRLIQRCIESIYTIPYRQNGRLIGVDFYFKKA